MTAAAAAIKSKKSTLEISDVVHRSPSELKPWPSNPRTHSDRQIAALKAAIRRFGFTTPIVIDDCNVVVNGHGRLQAAKELGLSTVPARVISGLTEAEKCACVIADNKIAELSGWDKDLLKAELEILIKADFEVESTGFSTAEIDIILDGSPQAKESDPDDLRAEDIAEGVVSRVGDLWQLGQHRLLCGNALDAQCYKAVMQDELAQMVITDPPYNVPIDGHVCGTGKVKHKEFAMASGEMSQKQFTAFLNAVMLHLHAFSQDGAVHFYFMDWRHMRELQDAAQPFFGPPRQLCIWAKDNAGLGTFYRSQHELVFVFKKGDAPHINNFELGQHGRYRTNVW